ncbi:MAG TPA: hypothetical protein VGA13_12040 [Acidimicrobiales bacterium]
MGMIEKALAVAAAITVGASMVPAHAEPLPCTAEGATEYIPGTVYGHTVSKEDGGNGFEYFYLESGAAPGLQPGARHQVFDSLDDWGQEPYDHCPAADQDILLY